MNGRQHSPAPPALSAAGLRKSFGDKVVLAGIDLHVPEGTVFALLGPNGAGKTTTVQILSTLIPATVSPSSSPRSTWRKPISSPTGSPCWTGGSWSPKGPRTSSSGSSPAVTSACGSPIRVRSARPPGLSTPIGDSALIVGAWCAGLALAGYVSARALFNRGTVR